jgi:hypothetical protein
MQESEGGGEEWLRGQWPLLTVELLLRYEPTSIAWLGVGDLDTANPGFRRYVGMVQCNALGGCCLSFL